MRDINFDEVHRDDTAYWAAAIMLAIRSGNKSNEKTARQNLRRLGYEIKEKERVSVFDLLDSPDVAVSKNKGSRMSERTCRDCVFFCQKSVGQGECRQQPPTVVNLVGIFPTVSEDEWCGSWRAEHPKRTKIERDQK